MPRTSEVEASWVLPFSVADEMAIDGMDAPTRAVVERYARNGSGFGAARTHAAQEVAEVVVEDLRGLIESAVERGLRRQSMT